MRKTVNGVDHLYTVNGSQILAEEWGYELLVYLYDANGAPIGMEYRDSTYAAGVYDLFVFETNMFGDITGVYDADGNKLISYTYDAWGNCQTTLHTQNLSGSDYYAQKNPFRYRGYYYDTELGLYYLNARYYDPNTGRFISADSIEYLGADGSLIGYNLYAYCDNNPVMYTDPSGNLLISTAVLIGAIIGAVVGAGAGFGIAVYKDYQDDGVVFNDSVKWYDYMGATLLGGLIGAAIGAAIGYTVGYFAGATYANGLSVKSVSSGVKSFLTQSNKIKHVLGNAGHKLRGYSTKAMGKLMKQTLARGQLAPYKKVAQSAYWAIANSEVTFVIIDGAIKISNMWFR